MVAKDDNGKNVAIPGLILDTEDSIRRFSRSVQRQKEARNRSNSFKRSEFKINDYLTILANHNAKIEL
jgi:hypothetical protein